MTDTQTTAPPEAPRRRAFAPLRIESRDGTGFGTSVTVDGVHLEGITEVTWTVKAGEHATATIVVDSVTGDLVADDVDVQVLPEPVPVDGPSAALIELGLPAACFQSVDLAPALRCTGTLYAVRGHTGFPIVQCQRHLPDAVAAMTVRGHVLAVERLDQ